MLLILSIQPKHYAFNILEHCFGPFQHACTHMVVLSMDPISPDRMNFHFYTWWKFQQIVMYPISTNSKSCNHLMYERPIYGPQLVELRDLNSLVELFKDKLY